MPKDGFVSDIVPWSSIVAPGVIQQKHQGTLQRTYRMRGPDIIGDTREERGTLMLRANDVFKRLGGRWMLQAEAQRTRVTQLPAIAWRHPVPALIDAKRREALTVNPGSRQTEYYLTLTWTPPSKFTRKGMGFFINGPEQVQIEDDEKTIKNFIDESGYLTSLLSGMLAVCEPLNTRETLTYLHSCVSDRWHPVADLHSYTDIDHQLCDTPWDGGWYPILGEYHVRLCSITAYPAHSAVGIVRALDHAAIDYRWCVRWMAMDRHVQQNLLRSSQHAWVGEERSVFARLSENLTGKTTRVINSDATNKAYEADLARQEIGADIIAYGDFCSTVMVWDNDPQVAEDKLQIVMQAFANQGFVTTRERAHATAAWLSTHPGNKHDNVHRSPQHSLTLAHLCPGLTASWPGIPHDTYLDAGPWFHAHTDNQSSLVSIVNHVRDVGHFMVLGPTGSGKSTFANFLRNQWLQYSNAQCITFDLDGHARLPTLLLGGTWYELGTRGIQFQPLRYVDQPEERAIAIQWLLDLLEERHIAVTSVVQAYVSSTVNKVAVLSLAQRTMSALVTVMAEQSRGLELKANAGRIDAQGISHPDMTLKDLVATHHKIREVLKAFTHEGEYGWLFDGKRDTISDNPIQTFEMRTLLSLPRLLGPVLRYLFKKIEARMSTETPMLLLMDEAAIVWAIPEVETKGKEWMMTTRKKGVSLGFLTHSLSQVFTSALGPLLDESCLTRFFLPNVAAKNPQIAEIYARLGLTPQECHLIATARPQRDVYYYCEEFGKRLMSLSFGPFELTCMAQNTAEAHKDMDAILATEGRERFSAAWLRAKGFHHEAKTVEAWDTSHTEVAHVA